MVSSCLGCQPLATVMHLSSPLSFWLAQNSHSHPWTVWSHFWDVPDQGTSLHRDHEWRLAVTWYKGSWGFAGKVPGQNHFYSWFLQEACRMGTSCGSGVPERGGKEHRVNFAFVPAQKGHWVHSMPSLPAAKLDKLLHQREYEAVDY